MPIGLQYNNKLYHGTSSIRADSIRKYGFKLWGHNHTQRMATKAIYLVSNRPLFALGFANEKAEIDNADPVVLNVELDGIDNDSILDLTSDIGLHTLYNGYLRFERLLKPLAVNLTPVKSRDIDCETLISSIMENYKHQNNYIEKILEECVSLGGACEWDSAPLRVIAKDNDYNVMVAAIQDGPIIAQTFPAVINKKNENAHYKGLRYLDHIEVCILCTSVISKNTPEYVDIESIGKVFKNSFSSIITNHRIKDLIHDDKV